MGLKEKLSGLPTALKATCFTTAGVLIIAFVVYFGYAIYFTSHFLPHTYFGDENVGFKSVKEVVEEHESSAKNYSITILARPKDTSYEIKGSDISYSYKDVGEELKLMKSQSAFSWVSSMLGSKKYEYTLDKSTDFDKEALKETVLGLKLFDEDYYKKPTDATIDVGDDDYDIVKETQGFEPVSDNIISEVTDAVSAASDSVKLSDDCYVKPVITQESEEIIKTADLLDSYLASSVTYLVENDNTTLEKGEVLSLLDIDVENASVTIDDESLSEYVYQIARKYNTFGKKREFKTTAGDTITIGGGDYGWVVDKEEEAKQLKEDLVSKEAIEREPVYEQTALYRGTDDIGNTYVELDYTNQHMYYYKDGQCVFDAPIVSGKLSNGNGSPDGVFKIVYKESPARLVGETYDTEVQYFIPFAYNVGFHDATWQPYFGGSLYLTNGSHGCINMAADTVAQFYDIIEVGTPVIAYYRNSVSLWSESAKVSNAYSYNAQ